MPLVSSSQRLSSPFLTPVGLYVAAAIRVVFGAALFLAAPGSRAPKTLRIFGVVVIVAGIVTPSVGVDRARAVVEWWTGQGTALTRLWAAVALGLGLSLTYAVRPRRSAALSQDDERSRSGR